MKPVINSSVIKELLEAFGDEAAVQELIELYLQNSRERMGELQRARGDALKKLAHALRSSSLNVGAEAFAESLMSLEFHESDENVEPSLKKAEEEFQKVTAELADLRKHIPS